MNDTPKGREPRRLTYPEALALAQQCHRHGHLEQAESLYRALRELQPKDANPLHFLGVLRHQQGHSEEAISLIRESIAIDPNVASWHNNLGNVMLENQRFDEAAAAYARCVELDAGNAEVLSNLGVMLTLQGRPEAAEAALRQALAHNPGFADAHTNLGSLYARTNRGKEALRELTEAIRLDPEDPRPRRLLGQCHADLGDTERAAEVFRDWVLRDPDSVEARHLLVAVSGESVPDRAPDSYVTELFDGFAASFDAKLALLDYRTPEMVGQAVARLLGPAHKRHRILDIGCGTGLCGPWLAPYAEQLVGVDLSGRMLQKAEARGLYDELVKAEIVAYLRAGTATHDLIVSADVLVYFGRLDALFVAAGGALRPQGHLIFTVEMHTDEKADGFRLQGNGRYSHSRAYVEAQLAAAGLQLRELGEVVLRLERQLPVAGLLVVAAAA